MKKNCSAISLIQSFVIVIICLIAFPSFGTEITGITPKGPYPGTVTANLLDITWTAGSVTSTTFTASGRDLLLMHNASGGVANVTLDSVANEYGRQNDINNYELADNEYHAFWYGNKTGWADSSNNVNIICSTTTLELAVLRIPAMQNIASVSPNGNITIENAVGPHPASVAADDLFINQTAPTIVNGASFEATGRELLFVYSGVAATTETITIESVPDKYNRTGDISAYELAPGEEMAFWFGATTGWKNAGGCVEINASDASINCYVIRIPNDW